MVVFDQSEHDSLVRFINLGTNCRVNELTDNQMLLANSPVVLAGVMSLRSLPTSVWFESLAVISGVGCSKSAWSKCRISFGSHDGDTGDSTILPGRRSDLPSLSKRIERVRLFHSLKRLIIQLY